MLKTGIIGAIITAICCFTPILVIALGLIGMTAVVPWLDYLLFPMLAVFIGMIIIALIKRGKVGVTEPVTKQ